MSKKQKLNKKKLLQKLANEVLSLLKKQKKNKLKKSARQVLPKLPPKISQNSRLKPHVPALNAKARISAKLLNS